MPVVTADRQATATRCFDSATAWLVGRLFCRLQSDYGSAPSERQGQSSACGSKRTAGEGGDRKGFELFTQFLKFSQIKRNATKRSETSGSTVQQPAISNQQQPATIQNLNFQQPAAARLDLS